MTTASRLKSTPRRRAFPAVEIWRQFRRFGSYVRSERSGLALAMLCMFAVAAVEVLRPWPIKFIFDGLLFGTASKDAATRFVTDLFGSGQGLLAAAALAILMISVVGGAFAYGQTVVLAGVGRRVMAAIRLDLYRHIQCLSQSFHDTASSGDLLVRLTGDVRLLRELLVTSVVDILGRVLVVCATMAVMMAMDWRLAIVAVVMLPILAAVTIAFSRHIKSAAKRQRKIEGRATHVMAENLEQIRVIQAFGRESFESRRFEEQNSSSVAGELETTRIEAAMERSVEIVLAIGTCAVLWFGVTRVQAGALSPGDLLVFMAYLTALHKPTRKLAQLTGRLSKAAACAERVIALFDRTPDIVDRPGALEGVRLRGDIALDGVTFSYGNGQAVLKNADLLIAAGQAVALVSPSGSGKSTIAHLLLRFYEPSAGRITIDGRDIRDYRLSDLREQITVLLQEAVLFNATIRENIAYGRLDATHEEIVAAARDARIDDFIQSLPEGYDTIVGRRGVTLSGGQRQRIAIARAMIRRAPIVILDEPGTGLDSENRAAILAAIRHLTKDATCIVITHDLDVARHAERIVHVRAGEITESKADAEGGDWTGWKTASVG